MGLDLHQRLIQKSMTSLVCMKPLSENGLKKVKLFFLVSYPSYMSFITRKTQMLLFKHIRPNWLNIVYICMKFSHF